LCVGIHAGIDERRHVGIESPELDLEIALEGGDNRPFAGLVELDRDRLVNGWRAYESAVDPRAVVVSADVHEQSQPIPDIRKERGKVVQLHLLRRSGRCLSGQP